MSVEDGKLSPASSQLGDEKGHDETIEKLGVPPYDPEVDLDGIDEKKLIRKIDLALIPWLSFLYLLSFLDRTSIGNAKVSCRTPLV